VLTATLQQSLFQNYLGELWSIVRYAHHIWMTLRMVNLFLQGLLMMPTARYFNDEICFLCACRLCSFTITLAYLMVWGVPTVKILHEIWQETGAWRSLHSCVHLMQIQCKKLGANDIIWCCTAVSLLSVINLIARSLANFVSIRQFVTCSVR
jgi:hypothetical protein